jgi:hypothetical protein
MLNMDEIHGPFKVCTHTEGSIYVYGPLVRGRFPVIRDYSPAHLGLLDNLIDRSLEAWTLAVKE